MHVVSKESVALSEIFAIKEFLYMKIERYSENQTIDKELFSLS